jgi:hypothetical protein
MWLMEERLMLNPSARDVSIGFFNTPCYQMFINAAVIQFMGMQKILNFKGHPIANAPFRS